MKTATTAALFFPALVLGVLVASAGFADGNHAHKGNKGGHEDEHAALGQPGDPKKVSRTIRVEMSDTMRYNPSTIAVKRGETIKFVAKNIGKVKHEMVLGSAKELKEHAELMKKFPGMEHDDPNQISVAPGKTGTFIWQFTKSGEFQFGCLIPGHFEAGMAGNINVTAR
jgi:uncharacterized cupredoxin-like copper-binding protein